ncbi:histidine phosphatase family protein [uncultured Roseobacter sp.]|uniref:histidine phosphatase family protein n=1 Tax=uncultured Roseobacter sp. TaxID=114847 RepID=UPI0026315D86|nr:histidine phosphatase family protein [uncultured Roseobacter sp.]
MISRRLFLAAVPLTLAGCTMRDVPASARTTVILVRHADRAGDILNETGRRRAAALPALLAEYPLDAIYSPDIGRNLETAEPLSQATGLPVTIIPKENAGAQMTSDHPDGTVIWVGNKGNLRTIWEELGGPGTAPQEYGEVAVLELLENGARRATRLIVDPV